MAFSLSNDNGCFWICFESRTAGAKRSSNRLLLWAFALYFVAKALEYFDGEVFSATSVISGHSIKHVAAAGAVLLFG